MYFWEKRQTAYWMFIWQAILSQQIIQCLKGLHAWPVPQDPMMRMTTHTLNIADESLECVLPTDNVSLCDDKWSLLSTGFTRCRDIEVLYMSILIIPCFCIVLWKIVKGQLSKVVMETPFMFLVNPKHFCASCCCCGSYLCGILLKVERVEVKYVEAVNMAHGQEHVKTGLSMSQTVWWVQTIFQLQQPSKSELGCH